LAVYGYWGYWKSPGGFNAGQTKVVFQGLKAKGARLRGAPEVGSNIFFGDYPGTFFGQFEENTNFYAAVRYSFSSLLAGRPNLLFQRNGIC
jgi:hypothetical protein